MFATWSTISLGIALAVSGLTLAPAIGALYGRLGALTPDVARTEVFGWMGSAATGGAAIGAALAGAVVDEFGVRFVWLQAAVLAVLSTLLLLRVPPDAKSNHADVGHPEPMQSEADRSEPDSAAGGLLGETA